MNTTANKARTEKIDGFARVDRVGHGCVAMMAWESCYMVLKLDDGREIKWHTDSVEAICRELSGKWPHDLKGKDVGVSALVRGNKVWRMKRLYEI